jgi:hypothetical protein
VNFTYTYQGGEWQKNYHLPFTTFSRLFFCQNFEPNGILYVLNKVTTPKGFGVMNLHYFFA